MATVLNSEIGDGELPEGPSHEITKRCPRKGAALPLEQRLQPVAILLQDGRAVEIDEVLCGLVLQGRRGIDRRQTAAVPAPATPDQQEYQPEQQAPPSGPRPTQASCHAYPPHPRILRCMPPDAVAQGRLFGSATKPSSLLLTLLERLRVFILTPATWYGGNVRLGKILAFE